MIQSINSRLEKRYFLILFFFGIILFLTSCATTKNNKNSHTENNIISFTKEALSKEEHRKFDYYFLEAVRLKEKGNYDAAFNMYEHCLDIDPNSATVLYELSQFYMFLKQPERALVALKKTVQVAPGNFWYWQTLAAYYQARGDINKAIEVYEKMSIQFPAREEPLMALIDLYNHTQNYPAVIHTLNLLEEKSGKNEQISMEKFRIYFTMGNDKKAFKEIENLAQEYPNDMRYLIILGDVYLNNGKIQEAYNTYQKVLSEEPDNTLALLSLATYYDKTEQPEKYREQLDRILLNKKVDSSAKLTIMRQLIGKSEQTDRDSTKIISLFDSILKEPQEDAQIPMLYAQYLISKKMEKASIPVLHKVLELDPENVPARLQLLSYTFKDNDYATAIKICEPALEYSPEIIEFYYYLGMAYYQANRQDDALKTYEKGLQKVTDKTNNLLISDFYSIIGDLYQAKEMKEKAYAAYDSALVYNPDNIGALNNYAYFLSAEKKDLDRAEEMSYKTIKAEPKNETFLDTYAWILFEKGKYTEAKIYIDNAMQNGGDKSSEVVEHCGDIYFMNGEKKKAFEYWQKALDMGSTSKFLPKKINQKKYIAE